MKLIVLLSSIIGAAAFAPSAQTVSQGTALNAKEIKPKMMFVPCITADEIPKPGKATSGVAGGLSICIAADEKGGLFALGDKCPPVFQPLSVGTVKGGVIADPILGTKFNLKTGAVEEWCTSPLGKIVGGLFTPVGVPVYALKKGKSGVEVKVDVNYKLAYEQKYWSGVLDAQGKANGKYY